MYHFQNQQDNLLRNVSHDWVSDSLMWVSLMSCPRSSPACLRKLWHAWHYLHPTKILSLMKLGTLTSMRIIIETMQLTLDSWPFIVRGEGGQKRGIYCWKIRINQLVKLTVKICSCALFEPWSKRIWWGWTQRYTPVLKHIQTRVQTSTPCSCPHHTNICEDCL